MGSPGRLYNLTYKDEVRAYFGEPSLEQNPTASAGTPVRKAFRDRRTFRKVSVRCAIGAAR
eukprot:CAMPEP_0183376854 /NCGR_PEP_ID=MMETSP0164_2-20130417/121472_1 /TAXON_ID=221442 /ORGANISM="Coccolithus pelagicus ssp braarudi, Strain PLY182g" /LENGTH=60 /DNA_ID=CAMNT_0025554241 /DNA_START=71 /DNA_END=249 /DNA_ORIENTATION=+